MAGPISFERNDFIERADELSSEHARIAIGVAGHHLD
jgi:hypothetical protein